MQRGAIEEEYQKAKGKLEENRKRIKECDAQITALVKSQNQQKNKLTDCIVEIKKLENEVCCALNLRFTNSLVKVEKMKMLLRTLNGTRRSLHNFVKRVFFTYI